MKTSVIGYPRIGILRELKFASEKYFKDTTLLQELHTTAKNLRNTHWKTQYENGINFISSNDFSFYDTVLDTAVLLNVIPARYKNLSLSSLDTYFAMARGYQDEAGDVKALAMKKWFNTNYHYMVPEIGDTTQIKLIGDKPFEEFKEAKDLNIETKPVLIGAFTFLKLAKYTEKKQISNFVQDTIAAYKNILNKFNTLGAQWIQFDEPCLVQDLSKEDIDLFNQLYTEILGSKGNIKILLQTYFGDIRDCYQEVIQQNFDGIGLDFIEGGKSLSLIGKNGFPTNKILFAGLVNGKNIWKNNYEKSLEIILTLKQHVNNIVIGTSCSLLHVPYTLQNETKLSAENKEYFAFAIEKLAELNELKEIALDSKPFSTEAYKKNVQQWNKQTNNTQPSVQDRLSKIKDADFIREPEFFERELIQKETFNFPLLPTTTIGSFPQTAEVKSKRNAFKKGQLNKNEYTEFLKQEIKNCVHLQEEMGIDVLVHGEFERNDMVEYFGECLNGYLFTEKAWVQSYGTRCVKPPIIFGDISREKPMTVEWSVYAQSITKQYMKGMLTGPVTILNWSFPREDISLKEMAYQIALAIRDEVLDLEANGIQIIQIDEAALREKLPLRKSDWNSEYLDWAIPAFRLVHSGVAAKTQIHTHMCYSEFTDIISAIDDMDADVITFEASRSDLTILDFLKQSNFKTQVGPGVYDIHSPRIPSEKEIELALKKMLEKISKEKLWVNPDCGLKTRGYEETISSLENMVKAAKKLRKNI